MSAAWAGELDETGVARLAELVALKLRKGDAVALSGELGAGKTTFARALIGALLGSDAVEVPSPTFSLQQTYATPRLAIAHLDFYRLASPNEALELGVEDALERGAAIIEWPEHAASLLPDSRFEVTLAETADPGVRRVTLCGLGAAAAQARRIGELMDLLAREVRWRGARIAYLQGDASTRAYARLSADGASVLLMDAPRQPDGPPIRDGRSYSRIAHLAEDMARPFTAIAAVLRRTGLSAPEVLAHDLDRGLLLVEDLGDRLFGAEIVAGRTSQGELWRAAVDALIALRGVPVPPSLSLPDGTRYVLPRRDRAAFEIEIELLLDWYWPAVKGAAVPESVRSEFNALWAPVLDRLLALPGGWFLRDYHSPNLVWLPERTGVARVGILDFQDALDEHFAFDLVSLLQDARVTVPQEQEANLFAHYCAEVQRREPGFDAATFAAAYSDFGTQRNTRLLGLWLRLLKRDGKPQYLQHIPRTWGYLARNLRASQLVPLAAWYDHHFPPASRAAGVQG